MTVIPVPGLVIRYSYLWPSEHRQGREAVEIPAETKRRLGLDNERSWIVFNDANRFLWPGPDIRPVSEKDKNGFVYGILPYKIVARVRSAFVAAVRAKLLTLIPHTE